MNKDQLISENTLLRQQVESLTNQLEKLANTNNLMNTTETNLNWKELVGQVWNESGVAMMNRAEIQYNHLVKIKNRQNLIGKEKPDEAKIEKWSSVHQAQFTACAAILNNKAATHAVCEVRERKKNSTLGLLPTISELAEIITKPEIEQPELTASDKRLENFIKLLEEEELKNHKLGNA
jgi:hypothetical protein